MAWIASLASAGIGASSADKQRKAGKNSNNNASILDRQGYQQAQEYLRGYEGIGRAGAQSLAELMGLEGYRTKEESAFSDFSRNKPVFKGGSSNERDFRSTLDKQEEYSTLGDAFGGVKKFFKGRKKKRQFQANANNAQQKSAFDKKLKDWETESQRLKSVSDSSLANYDPLAKLRATPGFQFREELSRKGLDNSQVGRSLGGRAALELDRNRQGFAAGEYQNEYNRRLNLFSAGQSAAAGLGNLSIGQGNSGSRFALAQGNIDSQYYDNLNKVGQGAVTNIADYYGRNNRNQYSSSYDVNSPTTNKAYRPGQTLDPSDPEYQSMYG